MHRAMDTHRARSHEGSKLGDDGCRFGCLDGSVNGRREGGGGRLSARWAAMSAAQKAVILDLQTAATTTH